MNCSFFGNAVLFSTAVSCPLWELCVTANSISDDSTRGGHSQTGSEEALVQDRARWSCRDSCSSAELPDSTQRGQSLVTNQGCSPRVETGFFPSLGPSLLLLAFSPMRSIFIKIHIFAAWFHFSVSCVL